MEWVHLGAWGLVIFTPSGTTFFNLQWLCQGRPLMIWLQRSYSTMPWTGSINLMLSIIILYHMLSVRLPWAVWSINLPHLNQRQLLWVLVFNLVLYFWATFTGECSPHRNLKEACMRMIHVHLMYGKNIEPDIINTWYIFFLSIIILLQYNMYCRPDLKKKIWVTTIEFTKKMQLLDV